MRQRTRAVVSLLAVGLLTTACQETVYVGDGWKDAASLQDAPAVEFEGRDPGGSTGADLRVHAPASDTTTGESMTVDDIEGAAPQSDLVETSATTDAKADEGGAEDLATTDPCENHCENGQHDCGETGPDCGGGGCPTCVGDPWLACVDCEAPNIAVASPGRIMAVWAHHEDANIHFACFNGSEWTSQAVVHDTGHHSDYPRLAVDAEGRFHLVYSDALGTNRKIKYSRYSNQGGCAGSWSPAERLDTEEYESLYNYNSCWPNLDVNEAGEPRAVWTEDDYYMIHFTGKAGGDWPLPVNLAPPDPDPPVNSAHPDVAAGAGKDFVVWQEGHFGTPYGRQILFSERDGDNWSEPLSLADSDYYVWSQILAVPSGHVYVMATAKGVAKNPVRCRARIDGQWTGWAEVSDSTTDYTWSSITSGPGGGLHAVWAQTDATETHQVFYNTGDGSNNQWAVPRQVSLDPHNKEMPVIDVDEEGYAHIIWTRAKPAGGEDHLREVYYAKVRYQDL